jgi:hypothetical protein
MLFGPGKFALTASELIPGLIKSQLCMSQTRMPWKATKENGAWTWKIVSDVFNIQSLTPGSQRLRKSFKTPTPGCLTLSKFHSSTG